MPPVLAYLDPGAGSLILQAILGTLAATWVFFRHLWWRLNGRARPDAAGPAPAPPPAEEPRPVDPQPPAPPPTAGDPRP